MHPSTILVTALGLALPALAAPVPALSSATVSAILAFEQTLNVVINDIVDLNIKVGATDFETAYKQLSALAPTNCNYPPPVVPGSASEVISYLQTAQADIQIIEQDMINGNIADANDGLCAVQAAFNAIASLESEASST